jgi:hypothetical protein
MKRLTIISLVVLAVAIILAGCAFDRNALIGSWNEQTSQQTWQFTVDGKMILTAASGASADIEYQFLNDKTIVIPLLQDYFTYTIVGDTMTLTGQSQTISLTRVR